MRRPGLWIALIAVAVLVLVNVAWWLRQGAPLIERNPTQVETTDAVVAPAPLPDRLAVAPAPAPSAPPVAPTPSPATEGLLLPVQGITLADIHDTFDEARGSERRHEALDIMAPAGTPVVAVADGTIEKLFTSDAGGLTIYQFEPSGRFAYYYAHLQGYAPGLAEGAQVKRGDVLGTVGSTGNADPAAPHLHFAVFRLTPARQWWTGEPINPYPLLGGSRAADVPIP
ncbi:M23 family metallopeptidase [Luteimonas sp. 100069]|uniref:M23 family metallopeptidase n=1 Tax=Luteimonas sp. 100069 TaxID=2006109 RepID=UPI000F4F172A|nr:M23 family metallopeptidase [Luteimonas sp. 100069]RPD84052.1 M23 family metallopeptidase [Luteimonas sp. 100069]